MKPDNPDFLCSMDLFSSSPPKLHPDTLALLDEFFLEKADKEHTFNELASKKDPGLIAGLDLSDTEIEDGDMEHIVDLDKYRAAFPEDWHFSQFWYTDAFANTLASCLHNLCTPSSKVAFVCCPTGFVAFQRMNPLAGSMLLEFDQRFAVLSPKSFIPYDLEEPNSFPESLKGSFDIAVVDPPYLKEITNVKLAQTLKQILHPEHGKLLLITSTSVEDVLNTVYNKPPIGPLWKTGLVIEHGQLANDFACWGSWEGAASLGRVTPVLEPTSYGHHKYHHK